MIRIQLKPLAAPVIIFALLHFAGPAFGQYAWTDEKGVKQYSDLPPPPSVPANRILKQPKGAPPPPSPPESTNAAASSQSGMTIAEKNAEFRKRQAEQAEKEKKVAEETKTASDQARNCERARNYLRSLESGERLSRTDRNGEREYLTDEQRNKEKAEARRVVQSHCK